MSGSHEGARGTHPSGDADDAYDADMAAGDCVWLGCLRGSTIMTMPTDLPTLYDILGVEPAATPEEIRQAWRSTAVRNHPDTGGTAATFRAARAAFDILSDSAQRSAYDEDLAARGSGGSSYSPPGAASRSTSRTHADAAAPTGEQASWTDPTDQAAWTNDIHRGVADNSNCPPWCPNRYHSDHRSHQERLADAKASNPRPDRAAAWRKRWELCRGGLLPTLALMPVAYLVYSFVVWGFIPLPAHGMHATLLGTQYISGRPTFLAASIPNLINLFLLCLIPGIALHWFWKPFNLAGKVTVLGGGAVAACCLPGVVFTNIVAVSVFFGTAALLVLARVARRFAAAPMKSSPMRPVPSP